ncbi:uncharacterized protein LOC111287387 [Durio zibethinus]|uniref:Uncharacterized protein LOC111287387 n=1 Tax=Durio zibethinus TaxID=66656 RepID=A0A6P5XZT7_DURZI|nr:uncharacterized protein LOC111287387 [Durio zibethinus]
MASRTVGLIKDQNLDVHYNGASGVGKANISKAPRKAGVGGRKPLGDLSNSVNPTPNRTSKKENSKVLSFTEKDSCASKLTHDSSKKKSVSKASEKVQAGGRKALSDISNSGKPHLQETSKKNQTAKLTILAEDPSHPKDIAEEGFLHNHEECIKAQKGAISMKEFLRILGLDDFSKQSASTKEPPLSNKMMYMSPPRDFEPLEMTKLLIEDPSPPKHKMSRKLDSAPPSPEPLDHYIHWNDPEYIPSFKLIESP